MPELPEVETIRRTLIQKQILGKRVKKVHLPASRLLRKPNQTHPSSCILNRNHFIRIFTQTIVDLERWGKYLMFRGESHSLILHLGMSGVIYWKDHSSSQSSHPTHLYLKLSFHDGTELLFTDPRTFGHIIPVVNPQTDIYHPQAILKNCGVDLGPDTLITHSKELSQWCWEKTHPLNHHSRPSTRPLKSILLDQKILAGIGNIYADESLFRSQLSPLKPAYSLTLKNWKDLINNLKKVFRKALQTGGSTLKDYRRPDGLEGNFQSRFTVYGKADQPCIQCENPLLKTIIQSRSTVYCPNCQK